MRIPFQIQTEEVADGRSATSAQPRHAAADLTPPRHSSPGPRPDSRAFAVRTNGAPQEGLLFAPLSVRSQDRKTVAGKTFSKLENSR
jgi:hypothetical protein